MHTTTPHSSTYYRSHFRTHLEHRKRHNNLQQFSTQYLCSVYDWMPARDLRRRSRTKKQLSWMYLVTRRSSGRVLHARASKRNSVLETAQKKSFSKQKTQEHLVHHVPLSQLEAYAKTASASGITSSVANRIPCATISYCVKLFHGCGRRGCLPMRWRWRRTSSGRPMNSKQYAKSCD